MNISKQFFLSLQIYKIDILSNLQINLKLLKILKKTFYFIIFIRKPKHEFHLTDGLKS